MSNILLDYFFSITSIEPTAAANTGFLRQALVVVKPKLGVPKDIVLCTTIAQVQALTDNLDIVQAFNAGMSRVFVLPSADLDLSDILIGRERDFYTVIISSDFGDVDVVGADPVAAQFAEIKIADALYKAKVAGEASNDLTIKITDGGTAGSESVTMVGDAIEVIVEAGVTTYNQLKSAIEASSANTDIEVIIDDGEGGSVVAANAEPAALAGGSEAQAGNDPMALGTWGGVVAVSSTDIAFLEAQAIIRNRVAFKTTSATKGQNMLYAFGKLFANALRWRNQQYIEMPFSDDVTDKGTADALFDSKVSFVLTDSEYGNRLALFAAGQKAIVAPYILRNLQIDLQSKGLQYMTANQPAYTPKQAALLEDSLQAVIDQSYIATEMIEAGTVQIKLEQANFVASGEIEVTEPKAMWRIFAEMRQTV